MDHVRGHIHPYPPPPPFLTSTWNLTTPKVTIAHYKLSRTFKNTLFSLSRSIVICFEGVLLMEEKINASDLVRLGCERILKKNAEVESMYRKKILSVFTNVCTVSANKPIFGIEKIHW